MLTEVQTDLDSLPRPQGTAYDIGALEFVDGRVPQAPSGVRIIAN
jgi:hypothetical protein